MTTGSSQTHKTSKHKKKNIEVIYEYQGKIQGNHSVYLPSKSLMSKKLVFHAHLKIIYGGDN